MTDNNLIKLFFPLITAKMTEYGYPITMRQSYNPVTQGAEISPSLYFHKISDKRIGHPKRESKLVNAVMTCTDRQRKQSTFQITSLVRQTGDANQFTASDYLNICAMIMQSSEFIEELQKNGIGILKISEIRNPYFKNDKEQFEASPSFDFVVIHNQELVRTGTVIETIEYNMGFV